MMGLLVATGFVNGDINEMFVNGWKSVLYIALIMAVFSGIYPRIGYTTRTAHVLGAPEEVKSIIDEVMDLHGFRLESADEAEGRYTYRRKSVLTRIIKIGEDRITLSSSAAGIEVEGITKDVVRIVSGLEVKSGREDA